MNNHIVITGASSGMGAELAKAFAAPGKVLFLIGRNSDRLAKISESCSAAGAKIIQASLDITDQPAFTHALQTFDQTYPIDLLIANAGITGGVSKNKDIESLKLIHALIDTNLKSGIMAVHSVLDAMRKRNQGHIVFVSSLMAIRGFPHSPVYSATKAGLKAYSEGLRALLRPHNIAVTLVLPGFVETPMSNQITTDKMGMISAENAALKIKNAILKKQNVLAFPLYLYWGCWLIVLLPSRLVDFFLNRAESDTPFCLAEENMHNA